MRARSVLFDVYGDYVAARGGWASVAGLVRVVRPLEVTPPATRTAVSRMVREGWLAPREVAGVRGYAATDRAEARLDEARRRIYDTAAPGWDGTWDVVVVPPVETRSGRDRVAASLRYLGYAALAPQTWVAPRRNPELAGALEVEGVGWTSFASRLDGDDAGLARRLWDLDELAAGYRAFLADLRDQGPTPTDDVPAEAFRRRLLLLRRWRAFLFTDPGLPSSVLPADWPRPAAAREFERVARSLRPAAETHVDACLDRGERAP